MRPTNPPLETPASDVPAPNDISNFLDQVHRDWETTRSQFLVNTYPLSQWPMPFFGNPASALVATIGVNPSSSEFDPARLWGAVQTKKDWKLRLRDYFRHRVPPHEWFESWQVGLAVLGLSYQEGTAVHLDLSYRATTAMLKNPSTDLAEFRRMVEQDSAHFFRLLLLCPNLRLLLTSGPIPGETRGRPEALFSFIFAAAEQHGFTKIRDGDFWKLWHKPSGRSFVVHEAETPGGNCPTCRVVKNLYENRDKLRSHLR